MRRKPHATSYRRAFVVAVVAAGAAGCADMRRATGLDAEGLNIESPAAGAVMAVQAQRLPRPSFTDVPAKPADLPKPQGFANRVARLNTERHDLNVWTAGNPPMLSGTEGYASTQRKGVGTTAADAPAADTTDRTTAWARMMRDAAKAPPQPQSPPAPPSP